MLIIVLWLLFAVCVAAFSRSRGHSFLLTLALSVLFSPIVGLIIELCRANKQHAAAPASQLPV